MNQEMKSEIIDLKKSNNNKKKNKTTLAALF